MHPDRANLLTEQPLPDAAELDRMPLIDAVHLMNTQDLHAVRAVGAVAEQIACAVEAIVRGLLAGGRLIYVGAGTSGRLAVLDAAECPPTFRTDPHMVQGLIAGGEQAMFQAREGAEDDAPEAARQIRERNVGPNDTILGIAAGGTTPFVAGALAQARASGAGTVFLTCVQPFRGEPPADVVIRPLTGPEVLTGSTRLKAGTATKLVLNTISTLAMVRLGKVYKNWMVDLRATNAKLRDRAIRIVQAVTAVERPTAADLLDRADGHVKLAIVLQQCRVAPEDARKLLHAAGGNLRTVLEQHTSMPRAPEA